MIRGDLPVAVRTQVTLDEKLKVVTGRIRPGAVSRYVHETMGDSVLSNLV